MSMVSAKTLEITGVRSPDLSKCREIFGKYSKFYKEDDAFEILEANADKTDVIKLFLESVDCPLNGQKLSGIIGKIFCFRAVPSYGIQQKLVSIYDLMLSHLSDIFFLFLLHSFPFLSEFIKKSFHLRFFCTPKGIVLDHVWHLGLNNCCLN